MNRRVNMLDVQGDRRFREATADALKRSKPGQR